jgi:anti-sigma factor RsiW
MNCEKVRKTLSAFLDGNLAPERLDTMTQHLAQCRDCSSYAADLGDLHSALRSLPAVTPPARLATELQVLASRERIRHLTRRTYSALFHYWMAEMRLFFDNLMRPIAIPFAGGLASAVFLFTVLVPTLQFPHLTLNDVPSGLFTQSVATVDEQGNVVDYDLPNNVSSRLRNDIANMILFTKFEPATAYGVPIAAKVVVSFRRIDVKG